MCYLYHKNMTLNAESKSKSFDKIYLLKKDPKDAQIFVFNLIQPFEVFWFFPKKKNKTEKTKNGIEE